MTPEDVHHFRAIGRAIASGVYYFGSFSEVRGAHYRGGYDGELPHILVAEIIEAVHRATRDAQRLPGEIALAVTARWMKRGDRNGTKTLHHSEGPAIGIRSYAAQPHRAGDRDAFPLGQPIAERVGT